MFRNLWNYRYFVFSGIRRDLVSRFARSRLKASWIVLHPLAQVAIYAIIFGSLMASRLPGVESAFGYTIYLMSGLLAWTLFSEITDRCLHLFVENGNLIKKMQFPLITLPAVVLGSRLISNLVLFAAMLLVFVVMGHPVANAILWFAPLTILTAGFALGVGLLLGVLNVFVRDLSHVAPILLQVWFWFTPIVYPVAIVPDSLQHWLGLNPLFRIMEGYRSAIVHAEMPSINDMMVFALQALLVLAVAFLVFRRANAEIADAL